MTNKNFNWENICNFEDYQITYMLYREGKNISVLSIIRNMDKKQVEKHIIKAKIELSKKRNSKDVLIEIMSKDKSTRLDIIKGLKEEKRRFLISEICNRYTKFKNPDDRMILIWMMGEIKDSKFLPFLRMELRSKNVNYRRLACSALGKIMDKTAKPWIEEVLEDSNPQVRQYAIKALSGIGNTESIEKLKNVLRSRNEKEYVKRAAKETIMEIQKYI